MTHEEELIKSITDFKYNKDKVQKFVDLRLDPKYGLSAVMHELMYKLYSLSSGDHSFDGRMSCSSCSDTIYRKLKDFLKYGDNMGQDLIDWEPKQKPAVFSKKNDK